MTELIARVQAALGDAFRVESELGGGGMSRLFLATEASLNRRVVIKRLPPDLASEVSAARFKQEMEFAARLQHPHILPILAAGAREGLLYYIMPYVAGESLRGRLGGDELKVGSEPLGPGQLGRCRAGQAMSRNLSVLPKAVRLPCPPVGPDTSFVAKKSIENQSTTSGPGYHFQLPAESEASKSSGAAGS